MKINQKEKPKTCLASARISTKKQTSGESLDDQVIAIKRYTETNGFKILPDGEPDVEVVSGAKRRPVYENHLRYIKENPGKVGYYVIRYIDRFTRSGPSEYNLMKKELADLGVTLVDTYGVIQPSENMPELDDLGFSYDWSQSSPSEMTETMMAIQSEQERKTILKRTIPKQIKYTQDGYHIGRYDDGYKGERVHTGDQIRYIQVPSERAKYIKKIFELRVEHKLTDNEIIDYLNNVMSYRSKFTDTWNKERTKITGKRGGKILTVKQMHRILRRTTYAGVICEKWTHNKPVRAKYKGIVSIDTFNKANRGKIFIKEEDEDLEIIHDYKITKKAYKRLRHNPEFPFKCIKCPMCGNPLKGSSSTGKSGKKFPSYHCARKHKRFSVSKNKMENTVEDVLAKLKYSEKYLEVLRESLKYQIKSYISNSIKEEKAKEGNIMLLKEKQKQVMDKYILSDDVSISNMLKEKLVEIENSLNIYEKKNVTYKAKDEDIDELIKYAKKIVEHPQKSLLDKENPLRQQALLRLVFDTFPTYEELDSGTPKLSFVFNGFNVKSTTQSSTSYQLGWLQGIEP